MQASSLRSFINSSVIDSVTVAFGRFVPLALEASFDIS